MSEQITYIIDECVNGEHSQIAEFYLEKHAEAFHEYLHTTEPNSTFHFIEHTYIEETFEPSTTEYAEATRQMIATAPTEILEMLNAYLQTELNKRTTT